MPSELTLSLHKKNTRLVLIAGFVLGLIIILNAVVSIYTLRTNTINDRARELESLTLILAEHTAQTIFSANTVLDSIMDVVELAKINSEADYREFASKKAQFDLLVDKTKSNPIIDVTTFVSNTGEVLNFSRSHPPPKINLSDRDYFAFLSKNNSPNTYYSIPVQNKGNGKWVFYLARRVNDGKGQFLGLILVGVSAEVFSSIYERVGSKLGSGASLTLFRDDLTILTRWPFVDDMLGTVNKSGVIELSSKNPVFSGRAILTKGPRHTEGYASIDRMISFRKLDNYPFITGGSITKDLYLRNWLKDSRGVIYSSAFSLLILLIGLGLLLRSYKNHAKTQYVAHHDSLTGLSNRVLLADRIQHELAVARRNKTKLALLYLDLDNFKNINDELGHAIGDDVLKEAANRIVKSVRDSDTVSRIGGDEFIVLLSNIDHENNAVLVAEKIRAALTQPIVTHDNKTVITSTSIGIAIYPDHGLTQEDLQKNADFALYLSKNEGRNSIHVYQPTRQY
ncbi:GGDEF domain-containing protein [Orrella sp. NBD-18]|uniref:GGDEF domain-containing protein n=1 Tax=Sheuella amnicola TaxID=2707330 RepID=A0A6B2R1E7_9BURK|nr:sensor domain-containing diguanylate cyclase [Sheuella amnicola]NDY84141.1 GGDEF domain-containing protein [Sheuella amnicola]